MTALLLLAFVALCLPLSAARKHQLVLSTFALVIALPLFQGLLPKWRVLPRWDSEVCLTEAALQGGALPPEPIRKADDNSTPHADHELSFQTAVPDVIVKFENRRGGAEPHPPTPHPDTPARIGTTFSCEESETPKAVPVEEGSSGKPRVPWASVLVIVWLVGAVWKIGKMLVGIRVYSVIARNSHQIRDEGFELVLRRVRARLNTPNEVDFRIADGIRMPMVWGWRRPLVLFPLGMLSWTKRELESVLLHELAHVVRRDVLGNLLRQTALTIYWFHPLMIALARKQCLYREMACDDHVLLSGHDSRTYAEHLAGLVANLDVGTEPVTAAGLVGGVSPLRQRLIGILDGERKRRLLDSGEVVFCGMALLVVSLVLASLGVKAVAEFESDVLVLAQSMDAEPDPVVFSLWDDVVTPIVQERETRETESVDIEWMPAPVLAQKAVEAGAGSASCKGRFPTTEPRLIDRRADAQRTASVQTFASEIRRGPDTPKQLVREVAENPVPVVETPPLPVTRPVGRSRFFRPRVSIPDLPSPGEVPHRLADADVTSVSASSAGLLENALGEPSLGEFSSKASFSGDALTEGFPLSSFDGMMMDQPVAGSSVIYGELSDSTLPGGLSGSARWGEEIALLTASDRSIREPRSEVASHLTDTHEVSASKDVKGGVSSRLVIQEETSDSLEANGVVTLLSYEADHAAFSKLSAEAGEPPAGALALGMDSGSAQQTLQMVPSDLIGETKPVIHRDSRGETYLGISCTVPKTLPSELLVPEQSSDLQTWTSLSRSSVVWKRLARDEQRDQVSTWLRVPMSSEPSKFLRIRVVTGVGFAAGTAEKE